MKRLLVLAAVVACSLATAAFDLQQVSRFNSSAISPSSFLAVAPKPGGTGFIAVGKVAEDVLVVEFDSFGGVVRTALWDSPLVENDTGTEVFTYSDGRVLVGAGRFLLQFSSTLTLNWEVQLPSNATYALDGRGTAYAIDFPTVTRYDGAGLAQGSVTVPDFLASASKGFPGLTVGGLLLVGRDTALNRACVVKLSETLTFLARDVADTGTSGPQATFVDLVTEVDGKAVMVGRSGSSGGLFATLSSTGVLTDFGPSELSSLATRVVIAGPDHVVCQGGFGLVKLLRATGTSVATTTLSQQVDSMARIPSNDRIALGVAAPNLDLHAGDTLTQLSGTLIPARVAAAATINSSLAAFVGNQSNAAALCLTDGVNVGSALYRFVASPRRTIFDSAPFSDGSVALMSLERHGEGKRLSVARYRPNGTLLFARTVSFGAQETSLPCSDGLSDGNLAIAADSELAGAWHFARINPAGTVLAAQTITDLTGFVPVAVSMLSDGSSLVYGFNSAQQIRVYRMGSTGQVLAATQFNDGQPINQFLAARVTNAGQAFIAYRRDNGAGVIRLLNPTTLANLHSQSLGTNVEAQARVTLDGAGALVLAYVDQGSVKLERRSASTLSIINSRTAGTASGVRGLAVAPNGNTICSVTRSGDDGLFYFGTGAFPDVVLVSLASTVTAGDVAVDATNFVYVQGQEGSGSSANTYAARYLANGIRSAQRRTAGTPLELHITGGGVWVTGEVGTRKKGRGPYAARYSL